MQNSFTVVMPSYLGQYKGAAKNRDEKIVRAIQSVIDQSYQNFELIIVADGCQQTVDIVRNHFTNEKINLVKIPKQPRFSGQRNYGIEMSKNDYICYLDIDDMFGIDHLKIIAENVNGYDWVWFNDLSYDIKRHSYIEHGININMRGKCGTANICHRKLNARWVTEDTYLHDWHFINSLKKVSENYAKIPTPEYLICHVPNLLDV